MLPPPDRNAKPTVIAITHSRRVAFRSSANADNCLIKFSGPSSSFWRRVHNWIAHKPLQYMMPSSNHNHKQQCCAGLSADVLTQCFANRMQCGVTWWTRTKSKCIGSIGCCCCCIRNQFGAIIDCGVDLVSVGPTESSVHLAYHDGGDTEGDGNEDDEVVLDLRLGEVDQSVGAAVLQQVLCTTSCHSLRAAVLVCKVALDRSTAPKLQANDKW